MDENIEIHQMIRQKKQKLLSLKDKLTALISKRDHLVVTKKKNLEASYVLKIGKYEYKLMEAECEAARLKRKIELLQAQINRNEEIDLGKVEQVLDREYRQWEQKVKKMVDQVKKADSRMKSLLSVEDSRRLQKLYRKLVKVLHPDINPDISEQEKMLWQRLQEAYRQGDLEEANLIDMLSGDKQDLVKLDTETKLDQAMAKYENKIDKISEEIVDMLGKFPFDIEKNLKDNKWVEEKAAKIKGKVGEKKQYAQELAKIADQLILKNISTGKDHHG